MHSVELINIKEVIRKRLEIGPIPETNYISSILKRKRIELKLTLSEVTKNICSEAFLSKVERNLMSSKNERVAMLCERLDLDYDSLSKLEDNKRVEKALYMYIDSDFDQILEMDEKLCEGVFVAEDEIIKAFKYLIKREFKKLNNCILGLDTVKECLSDVELFSLLLIVYEYNVYILRCNKALDYMFLLESFCLKNDKCRLFLKEKRFILSCIM